MADPDLVASFFTLTGSGFTEPPRHDFTARCRAAADAGFTGIGLHVDDLARTVAAGLDVDGMRAVLADTGLRFAWSAIPDVLTAVDLLRRAGAPNAGLMVDVWHFYHGQGRPELLADLPAATVTAVQLNDGPQVHGDHLRHARAARMPPGDGELDVVGLVRALRATGFEGPWCVEVNTPDSRALPVGQAAKRAADAALSVLDVAMR